MAEAPGHSPLSLRDCIQIAVRSSPDLAAARERINQAQAAVEEAQSGFYPRLSIGEAFTRTNFAPMVFSNQLAQSNLSGDFPMPPPAGFDPFAQFNDPGPLSNWHTQLHVEWPVFQGGKTYYGNRAALASLDATQTALRTIHNELAFGVSAAYYQILKAEQSIRISEESVRQIRAQLDAAQARYENEVALKSDVLRIAVRLAEAEEALAIARHNLERAKSRLNLAMGQPVNQRLELVGAPPPLLPETGADEALDELMEAARRTRPEVEGMDSNLLALENAVSAAQADYYPQLKAFAHYDVDTEDFGEATDSWTIGLGANLSIFDGFLTRSRVRKTRAQLSETEARKQKLLLEIELQVKNAYLAKSEAATRLDVLEQSVAEAEETLRIVADRYEEGLVLVTELLDAEVALTNARLSRLSAGYDYLIASAALERAIGRIPEIEVGP